MLKSKAVSGLTLCSRWPKTDENKKTDPTGSVFVYYGFDSLGCISPALAEGPASASDNEVRAGGG